ncbi:ABC transporter substrate-binding protein [Gallaecimonas xiamenensis]|uniref:Thiamine pyrimidine synthase n=1 Tax=Gallaecimonas xiamenensis 3-C-1 TaxID=745411 RepID=K2J307_9GAMM|nr:ABC transporter substrate-binding protein [Gallaecimonas xiamenensis]EKE69222.1 diguanylate cyclase [Gallaecimonas xiamenensis 3-C-1]
MLRLAAALALLFSFALAADPITLQLRWHHQPQFAGYYVALHKGFYKDEGLDVAIREGNANRFPVIEVQEGRAQFGVGNMEVLSFWAEGYPFVALAAIYQHSPSVLVARTDKGIKTVRDLVGHKVMFFPGGLDPEIIAMLNKAGISPEQLSRVDTSTDIQDFISGKVDAFNAYLTNEPYQLDKLGLPYLILDPRSLGMDFYSDILFTNQDYLKAHPDQVAAFRRASLRGWAYALDHPQETLDLINQHYSIGKSQGHMRFELDTARQLIMPDLVSIGHMNPRRWRLIADELAAIGQIPKVDDISTFLYQPAAPASWHWLPWLALALALSALGLLSWRWRLAQGRLQRNMARLARLEHRLEHDSITGLPTRARLCRLMDRNEQDAWLLMVHVDNLRSLNLAQGFDSGDKAFKALAERLKRECLAGDILARGDGARLLMYLPRANHPQAESFAEALSLQLGPPLGLVLSWAVLPVQPGSNATQLLAPLEEHRMGRHPGF